MAIPIPPVEIKKITDDDRRRYIFELTEEIYNVLKQMEEINFDAEIHAFQEFTITIEVNNGETD